MTIARKTTTAAIAAFCFAAASVAISAAPASAEEKKAPPANPVGAGAEWGAQVAPGAGEPAELALDEKQKAALKQINAYFNALDNLQGAFVQIDSANKRLKGKFYVQRPGRFRFDYALPSKQRIVSDGTSLAIQDLDLNNEDRFALDQTPFRLLLRDDVDLGRDARIRELTVDDANIVVTLQDKHPDISGRIKLVLATKPQIEIKEWTTTDAQGLDTRVEVSDLAKGVTVKPELFKIEPVGLTKQ